MQQLLSEEMRPSLLALCGGIAVADGALCWPLPGHTYISCHFGETDAFGNAGHRGTDIPAPEGTPILAAHSGTVLVSGWNDSYGNQVLLDNGAGLSTRYVHMMQTAVTAGEAVTAGQVIGYVGNTGDSTGFHLHFEVMQGGVLWCLKCIDALQYSSGHLSVLQRLRSFLYHEFHKYLCKSIVPDVVRRFPHTSQFFLVPPLTKEFLFLH